MTRPCLVAALLLVACAPPPQVEETLPSVRILYPDESSFVAYCSEYEDLDVAVVVEVRNVQLVDPSVNSTATEGQGHLRIRLLDSFEDESFDEPVWETSIDTWNTIPFYFGEEWSAHVELVQNDGEPWEAPAAKTTDETSFEIVQKKFCPSDTGDTGPIDSGDSGDSASNIGVAPARPNLPTDDGRHAWRGWNTTAPLRP